MRRKSIHRLNQWVLAGVGVVLSLGLGYLFFSGNRYSQLIGFFSYMCVACSLVPLPTPPFVIAFGKVFHPGIVAFVGGVGNCLAAYAEYYFIIWLFSKTELQQQVEANRIFQRFTQYFQQATFPCLVFTGFTAIPFEPFRLAAILIRYNVPKYLLAVFVGRFPRYYFIASIGHLFPIPNRYLIVMLIVLFAVPMIGVFIKKRTLGSDVK
ncbi:VTT domain-containing protein [Candidatus Poribacteria bacterium]|nr:VTT domain-containing protein [Candidatus Poribacteria bacterium]